ncbi:MAG: hypothetical protein R3B57_01550 [Phycisphaerales bacterium]
MRPLSHALTAALFMLTALVPPAAAQTEFTYQGALKNAGQPYAGSADLAFALWDAQSAGAQISTTVRVDDVAVQGGLFTCQIDFGVTPFADAPRWLEIHVRTPHDPTDTAPFDTLAPRQVLSRSPYSIQTRGIYVDDAGRIGIGTTAPQHELDIEGLRPVLNITATENHVTARPTLSFTGAPGPSIFQALGAIDFHDDTGAFRASIMANKSGPDAAQFNFITSDGGQSRLQIYETLVRAYDRLELSRSIDLSRFVSLSDGGDAQPSTGGILVLGDEDGLNLALDDNELMARNNHATSTLYLNRDGGDVRFGSHFIPPIFAYGRVNINGTLMSASSNVAAIDHSGDGYYDITIPGISPSATVIVTSGYTQSGRWTSFLITSGNILRLITGRTDELFPSDWPLSFVVINP